MTRLRYNGLSAALGASLTSSATAVTFAAALTHSGGLNVPSITGSNYIPLSILDSAGRLSEVVYLTTYTSGATAGTITRGQEGTNGVSHASGDKVTHGPTAIDIVTGDAPAASPSVKDDEFDGTSTVTWLDTPTALGTFNINTFKPGAAYLKSASSGNVTGKYQAAPAGFPYTVTMKVSGTNARTDVHKGPTLAVFPAGPLTGTSGVVHFGPSINGGFKFIRWAGTVGASFTSQNLYSGYSPQGPWYLRAVVNSATSVSFYNSYDGLLFSLVETVTTAFSVGSIGMAITEEGGGGPVEGLVEWFRVS